MANESFLNELQQFVPKPDMAELFKMIVKDIYSQQAGSQSEGRKELLQIIQVQNDTLTKARRLLLDDAIDSADYKIIKLECETKLLSLEAKLTGFGKQSFDLESSINKAVSTLNRLDTIYKEADTAKKRILIGSIYPEKLCFDGHTYRTAKNQRSSSAYPLNEQQVICKKKSDKT